MAIFNSYVGLPEGIMLPGSQTGQKRWEDSMELAFGQHRTQGPGPLMWTP